MLSLLRTRRWLSFTITALISITAFGLLSHWQWGRAHQEDAKAATVAAGASGQQAPLGSLLSPGEALPADLQYRPVGVSGSLDCSRGFLVRRRPMDGANGLWVACPMRLDGGAWLWVNRGWVPAEGPAAASVAMPPITGGHLSAVGRLRISQSGPRRIPEDLPPGQATDLDTAVLASAAGLDGPVYDPYIEVTDMQPADPAPVQPLGLPRPDSSQNYSYAGQWLLFAAVTIGGWWYFLRREAREEAERAEALSSRQ